MEKYKIDNHSKQSSLKNLLSNCITCKEVFKYSVFSVLLFTAISCGSSRKIISSNEENYEWQIVKTDKNDTPSWIIYTRKIENTNFLEYKIEGKINSSPKACISSFRKDIHDQADDTVNKKYPTYEIVYKSKDSLVTYVVHNEPFPLKDTEMSVRYIFYENEEGNTGVRWHEAWDANSISTSEKLNRVQTFRGHWNFSLIANNSCEATNSVSFDPEKMPLWLVEPMVFKFLINGLEDLRETSMKL